MNRLGFALHLISPDQKRMRVQTVSLVWPASLKCTCVDSHRLSLTLNVFNIFMRANESFISLARVGDSR